MFENSKQMIGKIRDLRIAEIILTVIIVCV